MPTQDFDQTDDAKDRRSRRYIPIERPNFSLPLMSTNFRRFNARCAFPYSSVLLASYRNLSFHSISYASFRLGSVSLSSFKTASYASLPGVFQHRRSPSLQSTPLSVSIPTCLPWYRSPRACSSSWFLPFSPAILHHHRLRTCTTQLIRFMVRPSLHREPSNQRQSSAKTSFATCVISKTAWKISRAFTTP